MDKYDSYRDRGITDVMKRGDSEICDSGSNAPFMMKSVIDSGDSVYYIDPTPSLVTNKSKARASASDMKMLTELHYEEPSSVWNPEASKIKFKYISNTGEYLCKLIHGESKLGGSLLRAVEWENVGNILFKIDQECLIGAKIVSETYSSNSPIRIIRKQGHESLEDTEEISSNPGEILQEFPVYLKSDTGSQLHIISYPQIDVINPRKRRERCLHVLELAENADAKICERAICALANPHDVGRFLVILGHKQKSVSIYKETVKRMLSEANIEHDIFLPLYERHTYDRIKERSRGKSKGVLGIGRGDQVDAKDYDSIVIIGDDGTFLQVCTIEAFRFSCVNYFIIRHILLFILI